MYNLCAFICKIYLQNRFQIFKNCAVYSVSFVNKSVKGWDLLSFILYFSFLRLLKVHYRTELIPFEHLFFQLFKVVPCLIHIDQPLFSTRLPTL